MDEQEKQRSTSRGAPSESGNKRRSSRRRSRGRRGNQKTNESQRQETEAQAQPEKRERPHRGGNAAKPKRRNNPRKSAVPDMDAPAEVMRATAPQIAPLQPMRMRQIDPEDTSEPIVGCPMLTRTRLKIPFRGNQRVARCSAGWSVHDEDEVFFCMHTSSPALCWKDNPEQLEKLIDRLRPEIEAELAAGDD